MTCSDLFLLVILDRMLFSVISSVCLSIVLVIAGTSSCIPSGDETAINEALAKGELSGEA